MSLATMCWQAASAEEDFMRLSTLRAGYWQAVGYCVGTGALIQNGSQLR